MIETLKETDAALLLFFNGHNNPAFDFIFFWMSDKWIWIPFYLFLAWKLFRTYRSTFWIILILTAIIITLSDQISSSLIKEWVMRLRPCHDPVLKEKLHLVHGHCGGKFGFISSHASNTFALGVFIGFLFKRSDKLLSRVLFGWAILVSFSRIYLGVHYPGDVLGGALLGSVLGYSAYLAHDLILSKRITVHKTAE